MEGVQGPRVQILNTTRGGAGAAARRRRSSLFFLRTALVRNATHPLFCVHSPPVSLHTMPTKPRILPRPAAALLSLLLPSRCPASSSCIPSLSPPDAPGWEATHFSFRIRTVIWAALLYLITAPLWLLMFFPGWLAWVAISIWFLYRIVLGMVRLNGQRSMTD